MPRWPLFPALLWLVFLVYGSLLPFNFQAIDLGTALRRFAETPWLSLGVEKRADWVANGLLFFPLGLLAAAAWPSRRPGLASGVVLAALLVVVAVALEFTQLWFPGRTVSLNDPLAETIGGTLGVIVYRLIRRRLYQAWLELCERGAQVVPVLLGLYVIAYVAYLLLPYDFLLSPAELRWKLAQLEYPTEASEPAAGFLRAAVRLAFDGLLAIPLGIWLGQGRQGPKPWGLGLATGAVFAAVLLEALQFMLASGHAQLASALLRLAGFWLGLRIRGLTPADFGLALKHWRHPARSVGGVFMLVVTLAFIDLLQGRGNEVDLEGIRGRLAEVHWLPFYYHYYTTEAQALANLGLTLGLYGSLGSLAALLRLSRLRLGGPPRSGWVATLALLLAALIEGLKLCFPNSHPDPTTLLLAPLAAGLACHWTAASAHWLLQQARTPSEPRAHPTRPQTWLIALPAVLGFGITLSTQFAALHGHGPLAASNSLPLPALVPSRPLPQFRYQRPRLPAPAPEEATALDPKWLAARRQEAERGRLDDLILMARLEPGLWPLEGLLAQLLALKPAYRGHEQAKPLALAYDWLYDQWSEADRKRLHEHALGACAYTAEQIRKDLLSPYNVFVYNSPLQALVACSIALYRDSPVGTALFNFARHYLEERMLPVWQQVMQDGGWHEGGEYVALGIGQAVYQIPALWRHATGVDWFRDFSGLAGFADFLVYRTQPDGSQIRMGDGGYHHVLAPDQHALALETGHRAAYALGGCPDPGRPSTWPWGPLTATIHCQPGAQSELPRMRLFRGLGLLVSRSDWGERATYVTFKAGDNYWSHSHLDQGSFTIFKGGPLALDSGVYGRPYGNDHHMNYAYQTVAHNVVTVTDPADNTPQMLPGLPPRVIANDGGQRRVGSGWGLGAAPIDRRVWEAERETYHTGKLLKVYDADDLSIAVADLTPAYTNSRSGLWRFGDRTRRVERYWRVFAHDRLEDVILVFDRLELSREDFAVRWLYHSGGEPSLLPTGFAVQVPDRGRPGRQGGGLIARVLLPAPARIDLIGGPGREFWVDGQNYDDGGKLTAALKAQELGFDDAGAWRAEVVAPAGRQAEFLVALLPHGPGEAPRAEVTALQAPGRQGCEIRGGLRHTRWWWRPGSPVPDVEQAGADGRWRPLPLGTSP